MSHIAAVGQIYDLRTVYLIMNNSNDILTNLLDNKDSGTTVMCIETTPQSDVSRRERPAERR